MPIHKLPPEVASQIAAGEVIERPASVVKELLENALDAQATFVEVHVSGAGRRSIVVQDDGVGIPADELPMAVERHATSKLSSAEDLFCIRTLGFRGEALASIASVSRLTITSRTADSDEGCRLIVEGGLLKGVQRVAAPVGTAVRVDELFYNTPARLKFLKSDLTERRLIDALLTRYALAFPAIRMHLYQEGKPSLQTSGNADRREILAALYGVEAARQMLSVLAEADGLRLEGFTSPLSLTRSNRREILFFVNRRPVQDVSLSAAVVQAYHTLLMVGRYPLAALFIELPPEDVDVNVHPAKAEVRFRQPDRVFRLVQEGVRRALLAHSPLPAVQLPSPWIGQSWQTPAWTSASETPEVSPASQESGFLPPALSSLDQAPLRGMKAVPILRLVGQIAASYLVAEGPDGLYLIDQHAAHERVLFEEFIAQSQVKIPSQMLLQPAVVNLPPSSARLLDEQLPVLARLGFQVEHFGPGAYLVRAMPALFQGMDGAAALRALVEDFEEDETPLQNELEARLVARICKRAAVKAGQVLSPEEQQALLTRLEQCASPRTCPHGRPTMIHLSVDLLERQFGRRGPRQG